ncbi:hypothetical protein FQA39_LY18614 [Lamprigera yunnana]|nr:hypothetical protein FQA39_LY18614 [Lamprigera yunnana]
MARDGADVSHLAGEWLAPGPWRAPGRGGHFAAGAGVGRGVGGGHGCGGDHAAGQGQEPRAPVAEGCLHGGPGLRAKNRSVPAAARGTVHRAVAGGCGALLHLQNSFDRPCFAVLLAPCAGAAGGCGFHCSVLAGCTHSDACAVVVMVLILYMLLGVVYLVVFSGFIPGFTMMSGLASGIVGGSSMMGSMGGIGGGMGGMGNVSGAMMALALSTLVIGSVVMALLMQVMFMGYNLIYLMAKEDLDMQATEESLQAGIALAREKARQAQEKAREAAEKMRTAAQTAGASINAKTNADGNAQSAAAVDSSADAFSAPQQAPASAPVAPAAQPRCSACFEVVNPDDLFCEHCGHKQH